MRSDLQRYVKRCMATTFVWSAITVVAAGCSNDLPTELNKVDSATLLAKLQLNYKAIILSVHAPYDTVRLDAVARTLRGDTLSHAAPLRFRKLNLLDNTVSVDSAGLIRAHSTTNSTKVIVSLTLNGVERSDTATIMVRSESPVQKIARVEFFPLAPDSAWRWAGSGAASPVLTSWTRLYNAQGQLVPNLTNIRQILAYSSSDPEVHRTGPDIEAAYVNPVYPTRTLGEAWLRVKFYAYDTAYVDSMLFRRIDPLLKFVIIDRMVPTNGPPTIVFYPSRLEIAPGTTVAFMNRPGTGDLVNISSQDFWGHRIIRTTTSPNGILEWVDSTGIVFDDPAQALAGTSYGAVNFKDFTGTYPADGGAGNIPSFSWVCLRVTIGNLVGCTTSSVIDRGYRSRRFTTPGTYRYISTAFPDASGTIIVTTPP